MSGTIITVAQQKGGSGKTTLCAHLAVAALLHNPKLKIAILDIDPQGSLGEWFEARERSLGEDEAGFTFRTASGWGARREARSLTKDHDLVFADTPPKSDREAQPAIEAAKLVIIPMQPSHVDLWATKQTLEATQREKVASLVVVNRVPPNANLTAEVLKDLVDAGASVADTKLGNRTAYAAAMGQGKTAQELKGSSKAANEIQDLFAEISKKIGL